MELKPFDKVLINQPFDEVIRGMVVGIKPEKNNTITYIIMQMRKNFGFYVKGAKTFRINSKEIENGTINLKLHTI